MSVLTWRDAVAEKRGGKGGSETVVSGEPSWLSLPLSTRDICQTTTTTIYQYHMGEEAIAIEHNICIYETTQKLRQLGAACCTRRKQDLQSKVPYTLSKDV